VSAEQERHIIAALTELRDTTVSEVMTPRVDVIGLPIPVHAGDVARAVRESGHSCFPVYDDDIDNLVGVLYVNDLFRAGWALDTGDDRPSPIDISRRLRQPYLVPETRRVLDVLGEMRNVRRTFAVVVDEYGGVAGIITVKDLLAALVGDLHDEFDPGREPEVVRVDRKRWLVDGGTSIDDVRSQTGLALPEGKYVTLGGYIFDALGHIPIEGERLKYGDWELRVAEMDRRRVAKVLATQPSPEVTDSGDPERRPGSVDDAGSGAAAASSKDAETPGPLRSSRSVGAKDSDDRSRAGA
jgi:magnesium and cobalt transporter